MFLKESLLALCQPLPWLETDDIRASPCSFVDDRTAQIVCRFCLLVLTDYTVGPKPRESILVMSKVVTGDSDWNDPQISDDIEFVADLQLRFDSAPAINIAGLLLQAIARRTAFEELRRLRNPCSPSPSFAEDLAHWCADGCDRVDTTWRHTTPFLTWPIWLMMQFRMNWNGKCFLNRWELAGAALEQLNTFIKCSGAGFGVHFKWLSDRITRPVFEEFYRDRRAVKAPGARRHLLDYPYVLSITKGIEAFKNLSVMSALEQYESLEYINIMRFDLAEVTMAISRNNDLNALLRNEFRIPLSRFLRIEVRRSAMLDDAFTALWGRERRELLKPLQVKIFGEVGQDVGGLTNEFFRLVFLEALNPDAGKSLINPQFHRLLTLQYQGFFKD
jgi:hypothetical protein